MKKLFAVTAALALLCLSVGAQADVFNLGPGLTNLETVRVGDAGNAGELSGTGAGGGGPDRVCGSVSYTYSVASNWANRAGELTSATGTPAGSPTGSTTARETVTRRPAHTRWVVTTAMTGALFSETPDGSGLLQVKTSGIRLRTTKAAEPMPGTGTTRRRVTQLRAT